MQKSIRIIVMFIRSALINGMCIFVAWRRKAPTAPSVELDERYRPTVTCCCVAVTQRTVT